MVYLILFSILKEINREFNINKLNNNNKKKLKCYTSFKPKINKTNNYKQPTHK
jgi:hypothetical protein